MNWTDQMQQFMSSWTEAQQKMASEWTSAMNQASSPGGAAAEDWAAKCREQAATNFETYLGNMGGVPGSAAQRIFASAKTYSQFVDFITGALRQMAPKMETGADWAGALKQYMEAMKGKMNAEPHLWMKPEAAAAMSGDATELWKLFMEQTRAMSAPWFESFGQAKGHMGEAMGGDHRAAIRMTNLFTDTFESTFGKLFGAPSIGFSRESQEKLTKTFDAWVEMKKAEVAFNAELTTIGFRAMEKLVEVLKDKASKSEKVESARELFDLWVEIAEQTYFEAASTEAFAQTQADLVNAAMRHRIEEKNLVEIFYKAIHLPTRQEIDDAYKHMHEMRSQVKKLTKTVDALQGEVASLSEFRQTTLDAAKAAASAPPPAAKTPERPAKPASAGPTKKKAPAARKSPAKKTTGAPRKTSTVKASAEPVGTPPAAKAPPTKATGEAGKKATAGKTPGAPKTAPRKATRTRTASTKAKEA
jgi:class III poly(R)-hydroxyalkanoic acid synthase PhaE subunit